MKPTHALFERYPLTSKATIATGEVPTPYHIYNGYGAFIGGTADLAAVQKLLAGEHVLPMQTVNGRALMGVWVCDFTHASLSPHHELQFSIFVSPKQVETIPAHPLGLLIAMLTRPDMLMMCHGLWNNTPTVVAYNRELLSLNARLADSHIERRAKGLAFAFADQASGTPILSGALGNIKGPSLGANIALISQVGLTHLMSLGRQPWVGMRIVNPLGMRLDHNAVAEAYTKPTSTVIRYFDTRADVLTFGETPYAQLGFTPHFVQAMTGFKFVYLEPQ